MKLPILTTTRIASRPDHDTQWNDKGASHWRCMLGYGEKGVNWAEMTVTYSMGSAHKKPPTALDVLGSFFSDASCAGESFADFCGNCGYDKDSILALKTYKACQSISVRLHKLLGSDYTALEAHCQEMGV